MSHHRSPTSSRRVIAVKRAQDEPLTRRDLQYDFLRNIFSDSNAVFTNPWPNSGGVPEARLTFQKLYIRTMLNSGKATKNFRERIKESEKFAEDFAMLALLVNVGRINTTMSCTQLKTFNFAWIWFDRIFSLSRNEDHSSLIPSCAGFAKDARQSSGYSSHQAYFEGGDTGRGDRYTSLRTYWHTLTLGMYTTPILPTVSSRLTKQFPEIWPCSSHKRLQSHLLPSQSFQRTSNLYFGPQKNPSLM